MENSEFPISIERTAEFEVDPDDLWDHLVDGPLISEWMGGETSIEPRVGGRIDFQPETAGPLVWGTVEEIIDGERIQWSWRTDEGLPTLVEIEIESAGEGSTTMKVRETMLPWHVQGPEMNVSAPHPGMSRSRDGRALSLAS